MDKINVLNIRLIQINEKLHTEKKEKSKYIIFVQNISNFFVD